MLSEMTTAPGHTLSTTLLPPPCWSATGGLVSFKIPYLATTTPTLFCGRVPTHIQFHHGPVAVRGRDGLMMLTIVRSGPCCGGVGLGGGESGPW